MQAYISWLFVGALLVCVLMHAIFGDRLKSRLLVGAILLLETSALAYWYWVLSPNLLELTLALVLTASAWVTTARSLSKDFPIMRQRPQAWADFRNLLLASLLFVSLQMLVEMAGLQVVTATLAGLMLMLALVVLLKIATTLLNKPSLSDTYIGELPTVTLAIPARNEDAVLESALNGHLKSLYPKLEIIVLDDCSQDSTAQIIKSFAQRGVRFIGGQEPQNSWLGKNYAYQQLLDSSSGKLILFCGADVKLDPTSITELVNFYMRSSVAMLAVLPNYLSIGKNWLETAYQISRYYWQLGLSGVLRPVPPVVGSCWLVEKEALIAIGGFSAVKQMIEPERFIAKKFAESGEYVLVPSKLLKSPPLATKLAQDQTQHLQRAVYPWLHHSILASLLTALGLVCFALFPVVFGILGLMGKISFSLWITMLSAGVVSWGAYLMLYIYVAPKQLLQSFTMPLMLLKMAVITIQSALLYDFKGLNWKGRDITSFAYDEELLGTTKQSQPVRRG